MCPLGPNALEPRGQRGVGRHLADIFGFFDPGPEAFDAGAKHLLARGYR
jgi:hypothetical protein